MLRRTYSPVFRAALDAVALSAPRRGSRPPAHQRTDRTERPCNALTAGRNDACRRWGMSAAITRPRTKRGNIMAGKPTHTAYTVREGKAGAKGFWVDIGSAWTNKDGSLSVTLDALPVNGRLVICVRKDDDAK
jgi:hypothetical protein